MVRYIGVYYFYDDGHEKCFRGMKVKPLSRTFEVLHAWITGQRQDESLVNGSSILVVQREHSFEGIDVGIDRLVKSNSVTDVDICRFFQAMNVPVNSLRASGYVTVVCELFALVKFCHANKRGKRNAGGRKTMRRSMDYIKNKSNRTWQDSVSTKMGLVPAQMGAPPSLVL